MIFFAIGKPREIMYGDTYYLVLPYTKGPEVSGCFTLHCLNVFLLLASGQQQKAVIVREGKMGHLSPFPASVFHVTTKKKKYIDSYPSGKLV